MVSASYKPAYVYGGPIRAIADLSEHLVKTGHFVNVYTTNANGTTNLQVEANKEYLIEGVRVIYHRRWTKDHSNFSPRLLWRVFCDIKHYDVVHLISWWNLVTLPTALICYLKGVRPVLSVHGTLSEYSFGHRKTKLKGLFQRIMGDRLLSRAFIHVTSSKEAEEVNTAVTDVHCVTIPNFIYFPAHRHDFQKDDSCFHLLFVGRLDPVKNIEFLLKLMNEEWNMPVRLDIMGEGSEQYTAHLKKKAWNNPKINWLGNLDGDQKWNKLANADLLLLPSRTENFGNVVIEGLSQGTPVLLSDQVGLKNYVVNKELGWVAKTEIEDWKKLIHSISRDTASLERIRKDGPDIIKADFNETNLVKQYLGLYEQARGVKKLKTDNSR